MELFWLNKKLFTLQYSFQLIYFLANLNPSDVTPDERVEAQEEEKDEEEKEKPCNINEFCPFNILIKYWITDKIFFLKCIKMNLITL